MWSSRSLGRVPSQRFHRFVGFHGACVFCLANARRATGFSVFASSDFARHGRFHRNFQLFPSFFSWFPWTLHLSDRWNKYLSTFLALSTFGFSISPLLLFFLLSCFWHIFPYFWPQVIWPGCCLPFRQPLSGSGISVWRLIIQYGERCETHPCIW